MVRLKVPKRTSVAWRFLDSLIGGVLCLGVVRTQGKFDVIDVDDNYRRGTRRREDRREMSPRLRASAADGQHDEMLTVRGGSEWSDDDRRSAERWRVGGSTSRACHYGRTQLRPEREADTGLWRGGGFGRAEGRRQESYDIIEITLIIDAREPGLIGGARMRERDRGDD